MIFEEMTVTIIPSTIAKKREEHIESLGEKKFIITSQKKVSEAIA